MRKITRPAITASLSDWFDGRTRKIVRKRSLTTRKAEADRLWASRGPKMNEIQALLRGLIPRERCCYCHDSAGSSIDHFRPRALRPELAFSWSNLLWACAICNSNLKRDRFPVDSSDTPLLLDPSTDDPATHLSIDFQLGTILGLTPIGEVTIEVFRLDRQILVQARHTALRLLAVLIRRYIQVQGSSSHEERELLFALSQLEPDYLRALALTAHGRDKLVCFPADVARAIDADVALRNALSTGFA